MFLLSPASYYIVLYSKNKKGTMKKMSLLVVAAVAFAAAYAQPGGFQRRTVEERVAVIHSESMYPAGWLKFPPHPFFFDPKTCLNALANLHQGGECSE